MLPRRAIAVLGILLAALGAPASAFAQCASPTGAEGEMLYNHSYQVMQFCNGTDWIAMGASSVSFGASGSTGYVQYNGGSGALSGSPNLFWSNANSYLGIGTSSPGYMLDIRNSNGVQQLHLSGDNADDQGYVLGGANGLYLSGQASYNGSNWIAKTTTGASILALTTTGIAFFSNASLTASTTFAPSQVMTITTSGSVGIGTTAPFTTLHVVPTVGAPASSGNVNTGVVISNGASGPSLNMGNYNSGSTYYSWIQSAFVNNAGVTEPLVLQQTGGNVGIGTTAPAYTLDVSSGTTYGTARLASAATDTVLFLVNTTTGGHKWGMQSSGTGTESPGGASSLSFADFSDSAYEPLVLTDTESWFNGNVGIGTIAPAGRLQVGNFAGIGANLGAFYDGSALAYNNGYIGFNAGRNEAANSWVTGTDSAHNGGAVIGGDVFGDINFYSLASTSTTAQSLTDSQVIGKQTMIINSSGNVGIGTTGPVAALDVNGDMRAETGTAAAGGSCSPNGATVAAAVAASGQNLICSSGTWAVVSSAGGAHGSYRTICTVNNATSCTPPSCTAGDTQLTSAQCYTTGGVFQAGPEVLYNSSSGEYMTLSNPVDYYYNCELWCLH